MDISFPDHHPALRTSSKAPESARPENARPLSLRHFTSLRSTARLKQGYRQPTAQSPSVPPFRRLEGADLADGSETSSEMGSRRSGVRSCGPGTPPTCRHPCLVPAIERLMPAKKMILSLASTQGTRALSKRGGQGTSLDLTFHMSVGSSSINRAQYREIQSSLGFPGATSSFSRPVRLLVPRASPTRSGPLLGGFINVCGWCDASQYRNASGTKCH